MGWKRLTDDEFNGRNSFGFAVLLKEAALRPTPTTHNTRKKKRKKRGRS